MADESRPDEGGAPAGSPPESPGAEQKPEGVTEPSEIERLDQEIARLKQVADTQAGQLRAWQPKVEAFNALQGVVGSPGAENGASPAGMAGGDDLDAQIAQVRQEVEQFGLASSRTVLKALEDRKRGLMAEQVWQRALAQAKTVFDAHEDREVAAEAMTQFTSGNYGSAEAALLAAESVVNKRRAGAKPRPEPTRAPEPNRPQTTLVDAGAAAGGTRKLAGSEATRVLQAGGPEARKLLADMDRGLVHVDDTR